jgi:chaperone modulatory protein CbpM
MTETSLAEVSTLDIEAFARVAGIHPQMARRLVTLGIIDATYDARGELRFAPSQIAPAARVQRLRATFALNYAAIGLVADLLDRIATLERTVRQQRRMNGGPPWT